MVAGLSPPPNCLYLLFRTIAVRGIGIKGTIFVRLCCINFVDLYITVYYPMHQEGPLNLYSEGAFHPVAPHYTQSLPECGRTTPRDGGGGLLIVLIDNRTFNICARDNDDQLDEEDVSFQSPRTTASTVQHRRDEDDDDGARKTATRNQGA